MRQLFLVGVAAVFALPVLAQDTVAAAEAVADAAGAEQSADAAADGSAETDEPTVADLLGPFEAADVSLDDLLWTRRPIVVFADTPADPRFQKQLELLLERPDELIARDVVIIVDSDPKARTEIRTRLRPRGFMLTLIAKDGRVNLRKPFPWDVREIAHAIDKWPIRQQEIRDRKAAIRE